MQAAMQAELLYFELGVVFTLENASRGYLPLYENSKLIKVEYSRNGTIFFHNLTNVTLSSFYDNYFIHEKILFCLLLPENVAHYFIFNLYIKKKDLNLCQ